MEKVIKAAIKEVLDDWGFSDVNFTVEHPTELKHGDYATNVALVIAKRKGEGPREVAEQLRAVLTAKLNHLDRIEIAGPGFLNFFLTRSFFTKSLSEILKKGDTWGSNEKENGEVVMIEYTSPNLFKSLHVGNLVGNIIGESVSRLFEFSNAVVKRLNYPSDIGLPAAKTVWAVKQTNSDPEDIKALGQAYRFGNEAYEAEGGSGKEEIIAVNKALYERSDEVLNKIHDIGIATSRRHMLEICERLGTKFDVEFTESQASAIGTQIVKDNIGKIFTISDGAVVYEGEKVGLHTRVFLNSKGLPTYEAKDVGNFTLKQEQFPNWTKSLIITGSEQTEYFKVLFSALNQIFPDLKDKKLEHIPTGFLTLTTGKMSSRKGNALLAEELLEEIQDEAKIKAENTRTDDVEELSKMVAVAALKYQILRQSPGSNIVFDKEKALSFEGDSGPYLQYTHARIVSVLEKAKAVGVEISFDFCPENIYEIEKIIYRFPEVIEEALTERAPHKVVGYLTELAGAFNSFYAHEKIADESDVNAPYKMAIAEAVKITLKNGLWILGIKTPERM